MVTAAAGPTTTRIPRIEPAIAVDSTPAAGTPSVSEPTRVIPAVSPAAGSVTTVAGGPTAEVRSTGSHIHRQVWNGDGWVLADDDRVFRPGDPGHRPHSPVPAEPAVFRPPDPPPWADHGRPETRTTRWPHTVEDPRRNR